MHQMLIVFIILCVHILPTLKEHALGVGGGDSKTRVSILTYRLYK